MKFISFIKDMLTSNTGISSKRVAGFIGWLSFISICVYCTINNVQAPDVVEVLAVCSSGLLGLETITAIWSRKGAGLNRSDNNEYRYNHKNNDDIYIPKSRNKNRDNNEEDLEC